MKPNLKFLQKVADGYVAAFFVYSAKRGGRYGFRGGEATAKKHAKAGFVNMPTRSPSLGMPAVVTLTEAGRDALAQSLHQRVCEMFTTTTTWRNENPDTIWNRLARKLGREPTHDEAGAEVMRLLREAMISDAEAGRLPHQRGRIR